MKQASNSLLFMAGDAAVLPAPSARSRRGLGAQLCSAIALAALAGLAGCASEPTRPESSDAGLDSSKGRVFTERSYLRAGSRLPAVVLQAGLQDDKSAWKSVIPGLSQQHLVIAFDRPGRADTPSTDASRDPCTIASEERRLLQDAGVPPPYILVGHSLGGLYQYVFAKMYPEDVAGLVLLDPTHPRHWETVQAEAPGAALLIKGVRAIAFSSADRREFDQQTDCLQRINTRQPLRQPVRLLVSGKFKMEERGSYERMLQGLRQDWVSMTGARRGAELIADSGHYIQKDRPDTVISAVQQLSAEVRK